MVITHKTLFGCIPESDMAISAVPGKIQECIGEFPVAEKLHFIGPRRTQYTQGSVVPQSGIKIQIVGIRFGVGGQYPVFAGGSVSSLHDKIAVGRIYRGVEYDRSKFSAYYKVVFTHYHHFLAPRPNARSDALVLTHGFLIHFFLEPSEAGLFRFANYLDRPADERGRFLAYTRLAATNYGRDEHRHETNLEHGGRWQRVEVDVDPDRFADFIASRQLAPDKQVELAYALSLLWQAALRVQAQIDAPLDCAFHDALAHGAVQRFAKLVALGDDPRMAAHRGQLLLLRAELEFLDPLTTAAGRELTRQAVAAEGLSPVDVAYAGGLLADSTLDMLARFEEAATRDPTHYRSQAALAGGLASRRSAGKSTTRKWVATQPVKSRRLRAATRLRP